MLETLSMQPMAHGTRSRHLLPKQKQQLPLGRQQQAQRLTRPSTALETAPQRLQSPQQQHQQHHQSPPNAQTPSPQQSPRPPFSTTTAAATRSIQNILNNATSMPLKRKAHPSGGDGDGDNGPASCHDAVAGAPPKRLRLSVDILAKPLPSLPSLPAAAAASALSAPTTALTNSNSTKKSLRSAPLPPSPAASETVQTVPSVPTAQAATTSTGDSPSLSLSLPSSSSSSSSQRLHPSPDPHHYDTLPHRHASHQPSQPSSQLAAKHKDRAVNGFKQELKGLHVTPAAAVAAASAPPTGGRQLRSQQATRFKSELAAYFPEYDEVIGNEPREEHLLNLDTPILLVESPPTAAAAGAGAAVADVYADALSAAPVVRGYSDALFSELFDSHVLDFGFLGNPYKGSKTADPLPDAVYEPHHKRAERLERSIRNSEKGRAQHEKDQIIRLLEGLQGPDWLRTMGVSGITESKKKSFEPAREHFIKGCRAILHKFRLWSLEEKRLKLEKDRAHAEEIRAQEATEGVTRYKGRGKGKAKTSRAAPTSAPAERPVERSDSRRRRGRAGGVNAEQVHEDSVDEDGQDGQEGQDGQDGTAGTAGREEMGEEHSDSDDDDDQPDSSDVDAVIARQLRAEALTRSRMAAKTNPPNKRRKKQHTPPADCPDELPEPELSPPPPPPPPPKDVVSFFKKRYQREAALSRGRRKGRTVMAWGEPVPELPDTDFDLPGDILEDSKKTKVARRKRKEA